MTTNARTISHPNGVVLRRSPEGLWLSSVEYDAGPLHLPSAELRQLGLTGAWLGPPSAVLRLEARGVAIGRVDYGPSFTDPEWSSPVGETVGDFLLAPVREGLDIWVHEYDPAEALADWDLLARLGITALR